MSQCVLPLLGVIYLGMPLLISGQCVLLLCGLIHLGIPLLSWYMYSTLIRTDLHMGGQGGSSGKTLDPCSAWLILVVGRDCMGSNPATDLIMRKNWSTVLLSCFKGQVLYLALVECRIKNPWDYSKRVGFSFPTWVPHNHTRPSVPIKSPTL